MKSMHGNNPKARTKQKELEVYRWLEEDGVRFEFQHHLPFRACGLESETCRAFVDFAIYTFWGVIILEIDEEQHRWRDPSCDVRRDLDIAASIALGSAHKIVLVHYSPDVFFVNGEPVRVPKRTRRVQLLALLDRLREEEPEQPFERLYLYYDVDSPISTLPSVARHWEPAARELSRVYNDMDVVSDSSINV
jgi:hypothetical protein